MADRGWKECLLGDAITLKRGYDLPRSNRTPGLFPIVSSSGISGTHIEAKVKGPGVVTGRYGTLGEVFYISGDFWPLNTSLYVKDFKGNDQMFIAYFLKTLNLASQNAAGAVPGVNRNHLHQLKVKLPDLSTQRRIASVLSAYDDLIENNTRRIAILEEMARLIYQEWFVHFRFPGHEKVKMVESELGPIPEGWEVVKVKSILKRLKAGKTYKEKDVSPEGKTIVVDQSTAEYLGFHDNPPDHSSTAESPIVIFGDHTCKMRLMVSPFSLGPNTVPFTSPDKTSIYYLFELVNGLVETREYKRHWTDLTNKIVPKAAMDLSNLFGETVQPMYSMIELLRTTNRRLRIQRDLLLPKLISGEIDVSDLPKMESAAA